MGLSPALVNEHNLRDYWRLIRPGIVGMVLLSMAVAAWTAGPEPPPWLAAIHALAGAALLIAGAVALNQRLEAGSDALMARTARRPLPAGRLSRRQVTRFGLAASVLGMLWLIVATGDAWLVGLAALSWLIYVGTYTPLKARTAWQTPVGALAGAMPVLLGAAVARAAFSLTALSLFGVLFFWQLPHAMAIAWLYREQFAAAEVKVAAVVDPSGRTAGRLAAIGAAALLPISLLPSIFGSVGWAYGTMAAILSIAYLAASIGFWLGPNDRSARRLLRASLIYLPLLLAAIAASRVLSAFSYQLSAISYQQSAFSVEAAVLSLQVSAISNSIDRG